MSLSGLPRESTTVESRLSLTPKGVDVPLVSLPGESDKGDSRSLSHTNDLFFVGH